MESLTYYGVALEPNWTQSPITQTDHEKHDILSSIVGQQTLDSGAVSARCSLLLKSILEVSKEILKMSSINV